MLFTSSIFLYVFLPALLLIYILTPKNLKNSVLALASLFFYFWGEVDYAWVFLLSVALNYVAGYVLGKAHEATLKRNLLILACVLNLGLLIYFKYTNFIVDNLNGFLLTIGFSAWNVDKVHLPIGISFITFHAMSYLIDIKRGTCREQKNPLDVLLYLSLFPQLIAGPIVRYHQIAAQIKDREFLITNVYSGLRRFIFGLAKKVLIANQLGIIADKIFAISGHDLTTPLAWLGITAYSLQLYFDFSGYSCMALGLALMFGFRFPENFNYPYISRSIQEFWRRWHISLSSWFRDYLYIPLGGNKKGAFRTYINLVVVFFLCGLWHGAQWNFVVWGLFHGMFLVIERAGFSNYLERAGVIFSHGYTILVFMVAWVFFRADSLPHAILYIQAMFGLNSPSPDLINHNAGYYLTAEIKAIFVLALVFSTPLWLKMDAIIQKNMKRFLVQLIDGVLIVSILAICLMYINESSYNPFIYFRF